VQTKTTLHAEKRVVVSDGDSWSLAASSKDKEGLRHALQESFEHFQKTQLPTPVVHQQIQTAVTTAAGLVLTGLWGSGPFSVTISGKGSSVFISVTDH
jgi:hypothetical protein